MEMTMQQSFYGTNTGSEADHGRVKTEGRIVIEDSFVQCLQKGLQEVVLFLLIQGSRMCQIDYRTFSRGRVSNQKSLCTLTQITYGGKLMRSCNVNIGS